MADEPRRSGRATKGQHTKDKEESETGSKQKGKNSKGKKGKAEPEPEDEEEDEYIRCICGHYEEEEDEPRAMICCDKCQAWQHNECMGLPDEYNVDKYFCEQCRPADHKELLAAVKKGQTFEQVAEARQQEAREAKAPKKKGKKGGRKSAVSRTSEVQRTPTHEPEEPTSTRKRKLEVDDSPAPESTSKSKKPRASQRDSTNGRAATEETPATKVELEAEPDDAPVPVSKPEDAPDDEDEPMSDDPILANVAKDPKEINDSTRSRLANNIAKVFVEQANGLAKSGAISLNKNDTAKALGMHIALQVEHAIYHVRSGGSGEPNEAYKDQMRAILNNIKSNPDLATRLMSKELGAVELASMNPKDMATDEQKQKDAEEKMRLDKQHVLVEDPAPGPRIRRTHKGDEYIDGSGQPAESDAMTMTAPRPKEKAAGQDITMKSAPPVDAPKPQVLRKPSASSKGKIFGDPRRKSSTNFDIDKVWSGVQGSPTTEEAPKLPEAQPHTPSQPGPDTSATDPEVDRLLKDEENESEPYSPKEFEDETVIWRGKINGGSLGVFDTTAKFAAGCKPDVENLQMKWSDVIPTEIKLHGRIQPSKADDYLCGLEYSNTTELVIVSLAEPVDIEGKRQFERFFGYLKQKERYGVCAQHTSPAIKDIYLLPMAVGQSLPTVMKALEHDFADPVAEKCLLMPIVIKWTELPHNAERVKQHELMKQQYQAAQSPSVGPPVAQTPITPHEPQMMQFDGSNTIPYPPAQVPNGGTPVGQNPGPYGAPTQLPNLQSQGSGVLPNQHTHQAQSTAALNANRVLGSETAALPAVMDLIAQAPNAGEKEFNVIKECIEENPEAGRSLAVLTQMLQQKHQIVRSNEKQKQQQQQPQPQDTVKPGT